MVVVMKQDWEEYHVGLEQLGRTLIWPDEFVIRFCNNRLKPSGVRRILDLGCGSGRHIAYLSLEGFEVVGCDISMVALQQARQCLIKEGWPSALTVAAGLALPFHQSAFDAVLGWRFLHVFAFKDVQRVMAEVRRILAEPGYLLFSLRSRETSSYKRIQKGELPTGNHRFEAGQITRREIMGHFFSQDEVENVFAAFKIINLEHVQWTVNNQQFTHAYWVVYAQM